MSRRFLSSIVTNLIENHEIKLKESLLRRIEANDRTDYSWLTIRKFFSFQFLLIFKFLIRPCLVFVFLCCFTRIICLSHSEIRSSTYFLVLPISVLVLSTPFAIYGVSFIYFNVSLSVSFSSRSMSLFVLESSSQYQSRTCQYHTDRSECCH